MPIRRRLVLLTLTSAVGAALFLPFMAASAPQTPGAMAGFVAVTTLVATLAAWPGLRAADAVALPMPLLRGLELGERGRLSPRAWAVSAGCGALLGGLALVALRVTNAPALPGGAGVRALTVVFAAVPLEVVVHLFAMGVTVRLVRGRRWPGIAVAALALIAFHLTDTAGQSTVVILTGILANGALGALLGGLYAAYGFEAVILGHAVAHLITVLAG